MIGARPYSESFQAEMKRRAKLLHTLPGYTDLEVDRARGAEFLPYEEAKRVVQAAGIKTSQEFSKWKRPTNIPSNPARVYIPWPGMSEFLGTGRPRVRKFLPYAKAKVYMQQQTTIRTGEEFSKWKARPHFIPCNPHKRYVGKGWKSWEAFLGGNYKSLAEGDFLPYEEARTLVVEQGIKTSEEFKRWEKPNGMPSSPTVHYREKGWKGWGEFLGTGNVHSSRRKFLSFKEARAFVQKMGIKTSAEYHRIRQSNLPRHPEIIYRGKWKGYVHFCGRTKEEISQAFRAAAKLAWVKKRGLLSYEEARVQVQKLDIVNRPTYQEKRTKDMPFAPDVVYRNNGWQGWQHFLGRSEATEREVRSRAARKGWLRCKLGKRRVTADCNF